MDLWLLQCKQTIQKFNDARLSFMKLNPKASENDVFNFETEEDMFKRHIM